MKRPSDKNMWSFLGNSSSGKSRNIMSKAIMLGFLLSTQDAL